MTGVAANRYPVGTLVKSVPSRNAIRAELERARLEFHDLVQGSSPDDLARPSAGTRWTNRQLLFHMLFGYLITRNLRIVIKVVSRLPSTAQRGFAWTLNAGTRPFDWINYWGSRAGGTLISPERMTRWCDAIIGSLHRQLAAESDSALERTMAFPTEWDPYFAERMSLGDVYHYATVHFDHHRRQLTLTGKPGPAREAE